VSVCLQTDTVSYYTKNTPEFSYQNLKTLKTNRHCIILYKKYTRILIPKSENKDTVSYYTKNTPVWYENSGVFFV
jgi:hypothetical protein